MYRVVDAAGNTVGEGSVTVDGAMGTPFTFSAIVRYEATDPGQGTLEVLEPNAAGGPPMVSASVPLALQVSAPAPLTGTLWRWVGVGGPAGAGLARLAVDAPYTLRLLPDRKYDVQADCNRLAGDYVAQDQTLLTLMPGVTTLAYCGPLSLDTRYLDLLFQVRSYSITGNVLELLTGERGVTMLFRASPA